ncbi:MAG TPA: hypothetical protein VEF04_13435, partial [Blastocatellia bacterium]|nr:hypothetical protein [Blastocatellia bacterium]
MKQLLVLSLIVTSLLSLFIPAQANPNEVLVNGKPPLTRELVGSVGRFFEWLFEGRLSIEQQRQLESILVTAWKKQDRGEIEGVSQIVELQARIESLSAEDQIKVRNEIRPKITENLRSTPTDEFSRLILSLANSGNRNQNNAASNYSTQLSDRSALIGSWRTARISMLQYQDRITGSTTPGNGTTFNYKFSPDGRFEFSGYLQTTAYNCTTTVFNPMSGTYKVDGSRVILRPEKNTWQMRNNCAPSKNMDRPGKMDVLVYDWRLKREDGYTSLCLNS